MGHDFGYFLLPASSAVWGRRGRPNRGLVVALLPQPAGTSCGCYPWKNGPVASVASITASRVAYCDARNRLYRTYV